MARKIKSSSKKSGVLEPEVLPQLQAAKKSGKPSAVDGKPSAVDGKPSAVDMDEAEPSAADMDEAEPSAVDMDEAEPSAVDMDEVEPSAADMADSARALTVPSPEMEPGALSPSDPLRRYLEEVRRHPLLEPEEEFRLAQKLRDEGDLNAAKALVAANLRLVVKIAFEYRNMYSNVLDLIQEGNVGLMKAVSKFDPSKGARLGYYASWWIRSYILKYLLDNFRLVKIGTTQAQKKLFYNLLREKERLEAQGLLAGPKLLADRLDVREKDVIEMSQRLSSRGSEMSLDAPVDPETGAATRLDFLIDEHEGADDALARHELIRLLRDKLPDFENELSEKERRLLQERLLAEEPKTLQEVADHYGLTRERARQIEAKVLQKLRDFLAPFLGTTDSKAD